MAYVPVELQRRVRERFGNCCAYCRTAEYLTATTFEIEHIAELGRQVLRGNVETIFGMGR